MSLRIQRLVIAGVGLIGGSLAAALRQAGDVKEIVGLGRRRETLEQARTMGLIDAIADRAEQIAGADMVVVCTPVAQIEAVLADIAPHLGERTIVTDVGSTKTDIIAAAMNILGAKFPRFVAGHPIAGAERNGPQAARADLFINKNVVLCPQIETDPAALEQVGMMWQSTGAQVVRMEATRHDRIFAAVSHLPHLAAFALVDDLAGRPEADEYFRFAASGFRDFTRIAGSSPEMWRDIALANREALLAELAAYRGKLDEIAAALQDRNGRTLEEIFTRASNARRDWNKN